MERLTQYNFDYCAEMCSPKNKLECAFCKDEYNLPKCGDAAIYEKLREYENAEQEGRLVVLPCKDSPVWIVEEATHDCDTVPDKDCVSRPDCEGCPALKSYVRRLDEFYFTREEAEKALKGVSEDA